MEILQWQESLKSFPTLINLKNKIQSVNEMKKDLGNYHKIEFLSFFIKSTLFIRYDRDK